MSLAIAGLQKGKLQEWKGQGEAFTSAFFLPFCNPAIPQSCNLPVWI